MSLIVNGTEITDLFVIDRQGNRVEIETLKDQLGNILFQKSSAPAWFNYTGIDANGNYEGTTAYDGNPVAYGIGKPTYETATDGTVTAVTSAWEYANGLNDEYFTEKYGDAYVKKWGRRPSSTIPVPIQVVEDILVIPDEYEGKPITTILKYSFTARHYSSGSSAGVTDIYYQPYFYKAIVFGKNITTIGERAILEWTQLDKIELPSTITSVSSDAFGLPNSSINTTVIIVNSNLTSKGVANGSKRTVFNPSVTEVLEPVNYTTLTLQDTALIFKHSADAPITITYASKPKTAQSIKIYTDNNIVKAYDWTNNANLTVTFYPLSDYTGAQ